MLGRYHNVLLGEVAVFILLGVISLFHHIHGICPLMQPVWHQVIRLWLHRKKCLFVVDFGVSLGFVDNEKMHKNNLKL